MQHIMLVGIGSSGVVKKNNHFVETTIASHFPNSQLHWIREFPTAPPQSTQPLRQAGQSLSEALTALTTSSFDHAIIQPLHLTAGTEFHRVVHRVRAIDPETPIGRPLLNTPEDHYRVAQSLTASLAPEERQTLLLIGHGTTHPSWTTYPAFAQILSEVSGLPTFLATLQHYPASSDVIDRIVAAGHTRLVVIPLLITIGTHFHRDIIGTHANSWINQLKAREIESSVRQSGLLSLPGIADIFCNHIQDACNPDKC